MYSINAIPRIYLLASIFFIIFIYYGFDTLFGSSSLDYNKVDTSSEIIVARLSRALSELNSLKAQNEELRHLLRQYMPNSQLSNNIYFNPPPLSSFNRQTYQQNNDFIPYLSQNNNHKHKSNKNEPTMEYELARRKIHDDIHEFWNLVKNYQNQSSAMIVQQLRDSLLFDLNTIKNRDNEWRQDNLSKLSAYVQESLHKLQNPSDCSSARKIVCNLNKGCGFGCQLHHVVYCTVVAMATERTLILNSKSWRYISNTKKSKSLWDAAFLPISNSCLDDSGKERSNWGPESESAQVLHLPVIDSLRSRPDYLPLAIPEMLSSRLVFVHGAPPVWFIGQIMKYLLRPTPEIDEFLKEKRKIFGYKHPIVGVHVRRTDKIHSEASLHKLSEYMEYVEQFYNRLDIWNNRKGSMVKHERLVYLATDDIAVWKKEVPVYQKLGFKFIGDDQISNSASVQRRYSFDSLKNVVLDIWMLSQSDYLVCTFSSQICRVAYELMQAHNSSLDRSNDYHSLDDIFYFGGQNAHNQQAILPHVPSKPGELKFDIGDIIGIAGNHWNGYSMGSTSKDNVKKLYPAFKARDIVEKAIFQLFQNHPFTDDIY